ncbi:MAG: bifunctional phosphopantothenoylcysteine decarboxylase/phosphopantothenate--cysteine ligase CoaBC [Gemmatimonadetes bacterium]|nr:bifunctional phosphopantothenoylcysteine decarboxylase/phosphopantothenate--cysteine ligase CoaBC [Gemmatimonadota bacterium]MDA1104333.1 bifunctional phosphopantothenoylcysteine decarboxylase/phosphopantothenate--cysteine ligase CoaBC [Gemmatimonadota bacterium]
MPGTPLAPRRPWQGRRIVLGVTGGIAAYKSIQLARDLTRLGAEVDVVLTRSAQQFVAPLSFEGVTGRRTLTDLFSVEGAALHVRLGREADAVCVAPATADFIARAAQGRADDLICTTLLATRAPVILCPAMNDRMFAHPQVQHNLSHIRDHLGYGIAGPAEGPLAVGEGDGPGRMLEPHQITEAVGRALATDAAFRGRRVLVTAGPTHEPIDPVRYVGNRSSGRMGYAIAQAAWRRGAQVTLVSGPSSLEHPFGVDVVSVETAAAMHEAVASAIGGADVSVFAAAVADFRPDSVHAQKMKRSEGGTSPTLSLTANPDIALVTRDLRKEGSVCVGFALETRDLLKNAAKKLDQKGFHLLVANDATEDGAGFEVDTNRVTILKAGASPEALPLLSKHEVAEVVLDHVARLLSGE